MSFWTLLALLVIPIAIAGPFDITMSNPVSGTIFGQKFPGYLHKTIDIPGLSSSSTIGFTITEKGEGATGKLTQTFLFEYSAAKQAWEIKKIGAGSTSVAQATWEQENPTGPENPYGTYNKIDDLNNHNAAVNIEPKVFVYTDLKSFLGGELERMNEGKNKDSSKPKGQKCQCPPGCQCKDKEQKSHKGDPIDIYSLEFNYTKQDLQIPGRGIDYRFLRTYRSSGRFTTKLGLNWDTEFDRSLLIHPEDSDKIIRYNGNGDGDVYIKPASSEQVNGQNYFYYTSPFYHSKMLVIPETAGEMITLRQQDGVIEEYHPLQPQTATSGKLAAIVTPTGDRLTFSYDSDGRMVQVLDSLSRPINYTYNTSKERLTKITDFIGREVKFTYQFSQPLTHVTSPVVTGTSTGNDFASGKVEHYQYTNGLLSKVTKPNEMALNDKNKYALVNTYDGDNRISSQVFGGKNASSNLDAGGTLTYSREVFEEDGTVSQNHILPKVLDPVSFPPGEAPDLTVAREITTATDRNGNEAIYYYNAHHLLIKKEIKTHGLRSNEPTSYITTYSYNNNNMLLEKVSPEGNKIVFEYDETNPNPLLRTNVISKTLHPGPRSADQTFIKTSYEYEPLFNQVISVTEARGNDPSFQPQNGGTQSSARYTTHFIPDYFEGDPATNGVNELAAKYKVNLTPIQSQLNQGDLNGDGITNQVMGNIIVTQAPDAILRANSPQVAVEGGTTQVIATRKVFNHLGQLIAEETPEGSITAYNYYPENDPDGDGQDIMTGNASDGQPFDATTGGYLKEVIMDNAHSSNYRGTDNPTQIKTQFQYDRVGNITSITDARGIRTDFEVNALDQIVSITSAADVSAATETGLSAFSYKKNFHYDANDNVIKTEVEYRDGNNNDLPSYLEVNTVYDILDKPVEVTRTVDSNQTITTQYRYDANQKFSRSYFATSSGW